MGRGSIKQRMALRPLFPNLSTSLAYDASKEETLQRNKYFARLVGLEISFLVCFFFLSLFFLLLQGHPVMVTPRFKEVSSCLSPITFLPPQTFSLTQFLPSAQATAPRYVRLETNK